MENITMEPIPDICISKPVPDICISNAIISEALKNGHVIKTKTITDKYEHKITIPITENTTTQPPRTPRSLLPSPAQKNAQVNNQTENLNDTINAVGEVLTQQHVNGASF